MVMSMQSSLSLKSSISVNTDYFDWEDDKKNPEKKQRFSIERIIPNSVGCVFKHWWVEILAGVCIIFAFSCLVTILRFYQNKTIPNWPLGLSINAALSLFGVIFRGPVLLIVSEGIGQLKWKWLSRRRPLAGLSVYDEASRGPWGSSRLIWIIRWKDLVAFLGAIITVGSLSIEPFTQAVVSYYACDAESALSFTSIGRINSFFGTIRQPELNPWNKVAMGASYQNSAMLMPDFSCNADKCFFNESYHSVGLCSRCIDITQDIQMICQPKGGCNYTLAKAPEGWISDPYDSKYKYTTAHYISYDDDLDDTEATIDSMEVLSVHKYVTVGYWLHSFNESLPNVPHVSAVLDFVSSLPVFGCRCYIYYCVRSYTATINHEIMHETVTSTSSNWSTYTEQTPIVSTVRVDCLKSQVQDLLLEDGYISRDTAWMAWDGNHRNGTEADERISNSTELAIPPPCIYQIQLLDSYLDWSTDEFFTDPLHGTLIGESTKVDDSTPPTVRIYPDSRRSGILETVWANGTISFGSLSSGINNITIAVTNYMRTLNRPVPKNLTGQLWPWLHSEDYNTINPQMAEPEEWNHPATGRAFIDTTCIHVRWPWLILPATIFIGTIVFLILLIARTVSDSEHGVWKSSQNALLWHGLAGVAEEESIGLETEKDMDRRARQIYVRLTKTKRGWKLLQD